MGAVLQLVFAGTVSQNGATVNAARQNALSMNSLFT